MEASSPQIRPELKLNLWTISLLLIAFGIVVSGYLSYVKLTDVPMACAVDSGFDCASVQNSAYSRVMDIPIAWLGLGTYLVLGGLLLAQYRVDFLRENGMLIIFGIVLFAFMYSMYLVYIQGTVLKAWCQWCLMHEATMTVLFVITMLRLRAYLNDPDVVI